MLSPGLVPNHAPKWKLSILYTRTPNGTRFPQDQSTMSSRCQCGSQCMEPCTLSAWNMIPRLGSLWTLHAPQKGCPQDPSAHQSQAQAPAATWEITPEVKILSHQWKGSLKMFFQNCQKPVHIPDTFQTPIQRKQFSENSVIFKLLSGTLSSGILKMCLLFVEK